MTSTMRHLPTGDPIPARTRPRLGHRWPSLVVAVSAAAVVWSIWRLAIGHAGVRLADVLALTGADLDSNGLWEVAEPLLDVVSTSFLAVILLVSSIVALLRRRFVLPIQIGVLMAGANLTTRILKDHVERPDIGLGDSVYNSWPSGHTTVAASASAALILAAPRRLRPVAALVGVAYTAATGVSTMIGGWHRPSDVVAAVAIALAWAALVMALDGRSHPAVRTGSATSVVAGSLLVGGVVAGSFAVAALSRAMTLPSVVDQARADLLAAYGGGAWGVLASACLTFGLLLVLLSLADHEGPDVDAGVRAG